MGGAYVLPWLPIHRHQLHYRQYLTRVLAPFALAYDFRQFLFRPLHAVREIGVLPGF